MLYRWFGGGSASRALIVLGTEYVSQSVGLFVEWLWIDYDDYDVGQEKQLIIFIDIKPETTTTITGEEEEVSKRGQTHDHARPHEYHRIVHVNGTAGKIPRFISSFLSHTQHGVGGFRRIMKVPPILIGRHLSTIGFHVSPRALVLILLLMVPDGRYLENWAVLCS